MRVNNIIVVGAAAAIAICTSYANGHTACMEDSSSTECKRMNACSALSRWNIQRSERATFTETIISYLEHTDVAVTSSTSKSISRRRVRRNMFSKLSCESSPCNIPKRRGKIPLSCFEAKFFLGSNEVCDYVKDNSFMKRARIRRGQKNALIADCEDHVAATACLAQPNTQWTTGVPCSDSYCSEAEMPMCVQTIEAISLCRCQMGFTRIGGQCKPVGECSTNPIEYPYPDDFRLR